MINQQTINQIKEKANLVAVISEYVNLKPRGKNFVGLCPFHAEKTGSFTVSPDKNLFHCFGCHEGGNLFSFIMKIEKTDFTGACEMLAKKLSIPIEYDKDKTLQASEKNRIFKTNALALSFFRGQMAAQSGEAARAYLNRRKIGGGAIEKYALGYASGEWDALTRHLISRGVDPAHIVAAGLAVKKEAGEGYYDRFRERIIFPIYDLNKNLCGFGGRTITNKEPKYLNCPDTAAYQKSEILYGLHFAKEKAKQLRTLILVEGYLDWIACCEAGAENVGATLGTALTTTHAKLIKRFAETVILCFDSDLAGQNATDRSIEILNPHRFNIRVCDFSPCKDPDEFICKEGEKAFNQRIADALPYLQFKLESIKAHHNLNNIEEKIKAAQAAAVLLAKEINPVTQDEYIKLAARLLSVDAPTLKAEVKKSIFYKKSAAAPPAQQITLKPRSKIESAEKIILQIALHSPTALASMVEPEAELAFTLPGAAEIFTAIKNLDPDQASAPVEQLAEIIFEKIKTEDGRRLFSEIMVQEPLPEESEKMLQDCLDVIKLSRLKSESHQLKLQIAEAEIRGEIDLVNRLHQQYSHLHRLMQNHSPGQT